MCDRSSRVTDTYEIRIRGALTDAAAGELADTLRAFAPTETVLRGHVVDQAELRGVLARLQEPRCELLEARRLGRVGAGREDAGERRSTLSPRPRSAQGRARARRLRGGCRRRACGTRP